MFKKILLPLDGSDLAEAVIPYGEALARRTGAELVLLHACDESHHLHHTMHRLYLEKRAEIIAADLSGDGTPPAVTAVTQFGQPTEVIQNYVANNGIDLVVMVREGSSTTQRQTTSLFDDVFRLVGCPAMLVPPHTPDGGRPLFNQILVPLDGSAGSEQALAPAVALARVDDGEITLFSMVREVYDAEPESDLVGDRGLYDREVSVKEQEKTGDYLEQLARKLRLDGLDADTRVDIGDDSSRLIAAAARVLGADMVVMATASVVSTWRAKSITHKLLAESELPLLIVRQQ
jgi:nucleotide-binding universal stress UspA family protein